MATRKRSPRPCALRLVAKQRRDVLEMLADAQRRADAEPDRFSYLVADLQRRADAWTYVLTTLDPKALQ